MELWETRDLMISSDYKERFKAEYYQLKIRYKKLRDIINKYDNGTLSFELTCPITILRKQKAAMALYLDNLEHRAALEGINL